jgi:ADP-ribose pyrophosphatase
LEKTVSSEILHHGRAFSFKRDEVQLPNGRRTFRDIVDHPGAVAIIPVLPDGRVALVRQYRYAIRKSLLELPAGTLEQGELPLDCARRELREETGYEAGTIEKMLSFYTAPGYSSEMIHVFVAKDLRLVGAEAEPDENITVKPMGLEEVLRLIDENAIEDAKTICGIFALQRVKAR